MRDLTDTSDAPEPNGNAPDFDAWGDPEQLFEGQSTKERMLDVIMQLRDPTKVATIAERAGCDTETARNYLEWFADLGLVQKQTGRPVRYKRNESFLRWRRIEQIRNRYSDEEIVDELREVMEAIQAYQDRFGVEDSGQVSLKEASEETTVEDAWEALSEWQTLEQRADLLDAARGDAYPSRGGSSINA